MNHLHIAGTSEAGIEVIGTQTYGLSTDSTMVHNNLVRGGDYGIVVFAVGGGQITDNVVQGCTKGFWVDGGNDYERVPDVRRNLAKEMRSNNAFDGFYTYDIQDNLIQSNVASNNDHDGLNLSGNGVYGNTVATNVLTKNSGCGINLGYYPYNTLLGNVLSDNGKDLCP